MKLKTIAAASIAMLLYSCGSNAPKTQVSTLKPDTVQVPPRMASPNESTMSPMVAEGKIMYENKCANCHKLFAPTDFSKEDWPPILLRMQVKAKISDEDMAKINNYVYASL
jgi:cytochrome c5